MKQALEAIANSGDFLFNWHDCEPNNEREMSRYQEVLAMNEKAFTTLRTAIDAAEKQSAEERSSVERGEPAAWREAVLDLIDDCPGLTMEQDHWLTRRVKEIDAPSAAPVQEPVAWVYKDKYGNLHESSSPTVPPDSFPVYTQEEIQRLSALVRAQQITIDKLEAAAEKAHDEQIH
jgi:hypothetical protein